jgi:hypothetical protein
MHKPRFRAHQAYSPRIQPQNYRITTALPADFSVCAVIVQRGMS